MKQIIYFFCFLLIRQICSLTSSEFGWIIPGPNDLIVAVNQTFKLTCTLNSTSTFGKNSTSSELWFYENESVPVDEKYIKIVNSTTIELITSHATPTTKVYTCKKFGGNRNGRKKQGIDIRHVKIGYPPKNVRNFDCRSQNWLNLTCCFSVDLNPIETTYKFYFGTAKGQYVYLYKDSEEFDKGQKKCFTDHRYRKQSEKFYFKLLSNNSLSNDVFYQTFEIDHFKKIIPDKPAKLNYTDVTTNSALIGWEAPIREFPRPITYSINYGIHKETVNNSKWLHKTVTGINNSYTLLLDELPFAFVNYSVMIRARVSMADDILEMWSPNATLMFCTSSRRPDKPPAIDIGGFHVDDNNNIYLYWKVLDEFLRNGNNITYVVEMDSDDNSRVMQPTSLISFMAKYVGLAKHQRKTYNFKIHSKNDEGKSLGSSELNVPMHSKRCSPPSAFKKILQQEGNGILNYTLSWSNSSWSPECPEITSYTIFWCIPYVDVPDQCSANHSDGFDFERVNGNVFSFNRTSKFPLNFAVSANTNYSSSGMLWAKCTAIQGNALNKVSSFNWTVFDSHWFTVSWSSQCVDKTLTAGYLIKYCPIDNSELGKNVCKFGQEKSYNITRNIDKVSSANITDLMPYTAYRATIQAYTINNIEGPPSDDVRVTTKEYAPTPPHSLKINSISNTSVSLSWQPPKQMNGVLQMYKINFHPRQSPRELNKRTNDTVNYILDHLNGYTEYNISIVACGKQCSNESESIVVRTEISRPSLVNTQADTEKEFLKWQEPTVSGGKSSYYEINADIGGKNISVFLLGNKCTLVPELKCGHSGAMVYYYARAVNFVWPSNTNNNNEHIERQNREITRSQQKIMIMESSSSSSPLSSAPTTSLTSNENDQAPQICVEEISYSDLRKRWSALSDDNDGNIEQQANNDNDIFYDKSMSKTYYKEHTKIPVLPGEWAKLGFRPCAPHKFDLMLLWYLMAVLLLIGIGASIFMAMKKVTKMKDISVVLPPGLPVMNGLDNGIGGCGGGGISRNGGNGTVLGGGGGGKGFGISNGGIGTGNERIISNNGSDKQNASDRNGLRIMYPGSTNSLINDEQEQSLLNKNRNAKHKEEHMNMNSDSDINGLHKNSCNVYANNDGVDHDSDSELHSSDNSGGGSNCNTITEILDSESPTPLLPTHHRHHKSLIDSPKIISKLNDNKSQISLANNSTAPSTTTMMMTQNGYIKMPMYDQQLQQHQQKQHDPFAVASNNYIQPSMLLRPMISPIKTIQQQPQPQAPPPATSSSGYVTFDAAMANGSSSVSSQPLQSPPLPPPTINTTVNSAYLPFNIAINAGNQILKSPIGLMNGNCDKVGDNCMGVITSPISPTDENKIIKSPIIAENEGISGYVTHKQLSDFGQLYQ